MDFHLLRLYLPLVLWVGTGVLLGRKLPKRIPHALGKGLFWVGVPFGIMAFMRQADLSGNLWVAPAVAWSAVLLGAGLAWTASFGGCLLKKIGPQRGDRSSAPMASSTTSPPTSAHPWNRPTQGSFLTASMFGNTGYLGYPVTVALVGPQYFAWAVFYDTMGSTLAAYGLGVAIASNYGHPSPTTPPPDNSRECGADSNSTFANLQALHPLRQTTQAVLKNPAMWSFWIGLGFQRVPLPLAIETGLTAIAWSVIALSLLLLGMRLSQASAKAYLSQAAISLTIKMILVPLIMGMAITAMGLSGPTRLILVLQAAMPPAFATLILAEAYNLDRDLTVTTLAIGSGLLLFTLPIWLELFGI